MRRYDEYIIVAIRETSSCAGVASMWWRGWRRVHGRSSPGNDSGRYEGAEVIESEAIASFAYVSFSPVDNAANEAC